MKSMIRNSALGHLLDPDEDAYISRKDIYTHEEWAIKRQRMINNPGEPIRKINAMVEDADNLDIFEYAITYYINEELYLRLLSESDVYVHHYHHKGAQNPVFIAQVIKIFPESFKYQVIKYIDPDIFAMLCVNYNYFPPINSVPHSHFTREFILFCLKMYPAFFMKCKRNYITQEIMDEVPGLPFTLEEVTHNPKKRERVLRSAFTSPEEVKEYIDRTTRIPPGIPKEYFEDSEFLSYIMRLPRFCFPKSAYYNYHSSYIEPYKEYLTEAHLREFELSWRVVGDSVHMSTEIIMGYMADDRVDLNLSDQQFMGLNDEHALLYLNDYVIYFTDIDTLARVYELIPEYVFSEEQNMIIADHRTKSAMG